MKRVLLVAGTGTLGGPTYSELVKLGYAVDVISLEDFASVTPRLSFLKADASTDRMQKFLDGRRYDAIVDFIHVPEKGPQARRIDLMLEHTDQFVFLSSYRTYSGRDRVITESSEQWIDAPANDRMLAEDDYAIPKARGERHLMASGRKNWTIVRPVISFTHYRLDLVTVGAYAILFRTAAGKAIPLPAEVRDKHCSVTWGDMGREHGASDRAFDRQGRRFWRGFHARHGRRTDLGRRRLVLRRIRRCAVRVDSSGGLPEDCDRQLVYAGADDLDGPQP